MVILMEAIKPQCICTAQGDSTEALRENACFTNTYSNNDCDCYPRNQKEAQVSEPLY